MSGFPRAVKHFILWDYPRAGWQYDLIVALILGFVFLTPREWFRDQPKASSLVMLPSEKGTNVYWMEPELLSSIALSDRTKTAELLLKARTGKKQKVVRLEPIFDSEKDVRGFMAFTAP